MQKAISVTSRRYAKINLKVYYNEDRICVLKKILFHRKVT